MIRITQEQNHPDLVCSDAFLPSKAAGDRSQEPNGFLRTAGFANDVTLTPAA